MSKCEQEFSDSDSEYIKADSFATPVKKKPKKAAVASPRISRQILKQSLETDENYCNVKLQSSPVKSPKNLKQLITRKSSPQKSHTPLTSERKADPNHIPYYLLNFEVILRGVIDETDDVELLNADELSIVEKFRKLDINSRKLYVRLFQRKHAWIMKKTIQYEEIHSLADCLQILCDQNFIKSGKDLKDLEALLKLLPAPDVRQLVKTFNLQNRGSSQKTDHIAALLVHSRKKSFFSTKSNMNDIMVSKARDLLKGSECYYVEDVARGLFLRILSLYSLSNWWEDRESDKGQNNSAPQLTTILLQNTGKLKFPVFSIIRKCRIFQSREDLLSFEHVCALETSCAELMSNKEWNEALAGPIKEAETLFDDLLQDENVIETVKAMPVFLRKFHRASVLAYILTKGVEIFEKLKQYEEATVMLKKLIGSGYLPDYHGFWYERLALDIDQHLKLPREALDVIKEALGDLNVQEARLYSLCQRAAKIMSSKMSRKKLSFAPSERAEFESHPRWITPQDPITMTIVGKMMPKSNLPGEKSVFIFESRNDKESDFVCSVEEYVKHYFKVEKGYTNGLHAEGSVVNSIAVVLFWDIVYELEIPDVFRSPQQGAPLDFESSHFYEKRKIEIEERLSTIQNWSEEELIEFVTPIWETCHEITSCPVNWELFSSLNHFLSLLRCFTGEQLSGICRRLMMNHRHTRSGFPDLTLWDVHGGRVLFVEVKGPNDRLSNKQILWLDYLNAIGIEALVCHVEEGSGMRLEIPQGKKKTPTKKRQRNSSGEDFV